MKLAVKYIIAIAAAAALAAGVASAQKSDRYVVILSMDGFRWDLAGKAHTPTLDSIRQAGSYAEIFPCFPANTFPNHYSMATGLHPDHHGIINNTFYDKALDKYFSIRDRSAVEDPDFWRGEPIWNTAERQGLTANVFFWVGSETAVGGRQASLWTRYDGAVPYEQRADWVIDALNRPLDSIPNLIMWYFEEPDGVMHRHGPGSPEQVAAVERIDSVLHYFMERVKTSPVYDKVNFIFTADHGMAPLSPERYVNLWPLLDQSRIRYAITSTPLFLEPDPDYVDEAFDIISRVPEVTVFRRERMAEEFDFGSDTMRITRLVVLPHIGWSVDNREDDRPKTGGGHGFNPFEKNMRMVFYGMGPCFKAGYEQRPFRNLNIYGLLCLLLDIEPARNDGDIRAVEDMLLNR